MTETTNRVWVWLILGVAACQPAEPPEGESVDFEAECAGEWPADACAAGSCDPALTDAYLERFQDESGFSDAQMADHVVVWDVQGGEVTGIVTVDWMSLPVTASVDATGTSSGEPVGPLAPWRFAPVLDPNEALALSAEEVEDAITSCEAEQGTTLERRGWCDPWFQTDPGDDDRGVRFDFWNAAGDVQLSANPVTGELQCRFVQPTID